MRINVRNPQGRGHRTLARLAGAGFLFISVLAQADVLFEENFDSGLGRFTAGGTVDTGAYGARMYGCWGCTDGSITSSAVSTDGFSGITLTFTRSSSGLDSGEAGIAEFSTDGSSYTVIESSNTASGSASFNLPSAADNQSTLYLRFRIDASLSSEYYTVDNVVLEGTPSGGGGGGGSGEVTDFTATYNGNSSSGTYCIYARNIIGKEPADAGTYPVYVHVVGTGESYDSTHALTSVQRMAERGFVAATVEYANGTFGSCSTIGDRARCMFSPSVTESAINALCSRAKADCSKGIVVSGLSQGSIIATLAKDYDSRVRAAYAQGTFTSYSVYNLDACMVDGNHALSSSDLRVVNGEVDTFGGGNISSVRAESEDVTGLSCGGTATSCLRTDGSGWYIVRNSEVSDGEADHCYMRDGGCVDPLDPIWLNTTAPWGLDANLDWLKSRVSP